MMNLNIAYADKDAAKAAFRAASIPLSWNAAAKVWQTSAAELPAELARYATAASAQSTQTGVRFYICLESGHRGFGFRVIKAFESKEAAKQAMLNGDWLNTYLDDSALGEYAATAHIVAARCNAGVDRCIPNQYVIGSNKLIDSKDAQIRAIALAAASDYLDNEKKERAEMDAAMRMTPEQIAADEELLKLIRREGCERR